METVIAAAITGGLTLVGVIITNVMNARKIEHKLELTLATYQAKTDCKIEELTREVREHNNFARRMPVVENDIATIYKKVNELEGLHQRS